MPEKRTNPPITCDVLIIGAGCIGLSIGISLLNSNPRLKVIIAEKEKSIALHASGRNSGVIHAGFYYSPDSLKAKFCRDGNRELKKLAKEYKIPVHELGKVVVSKDEDEDLRLDDLCSRGISNGVDIELFESSKLPLYEPLAITFNRFLWSPTTAITNSKAILNAMKQEFEIRGGQIEYASKVKLVESNNQIYESTRKFDAKHFINASGAQSDKIAREIGVGLEYAMLPFMGVYRATEIRNLPLRTLVYPVPHHLNPFLGVHFTQTFDNKIKIGPTAIPITGREQYSLFSGWSISDIAQSFKATLALVKGQSHDFGSIIKSEAPKFLASQLIRESSELVPRALFVRDWQKKPPGIRAQLVNLSNGALEQDFVLRHKLNSTHILNAVSPGWTSSLPLGQHVARLVLEKFL